MGEIKTCWYNEGADRVPRYTEQSIKIKRNAVGSFDGRIRLSSKGYVDFFIDKVYIQKGDEPLPICMTLEEVEDLFQEMKDFKETGMPRVSYVHEKPPGDSGQMIVKNLKKELLKKDKEIEELKKIKERANTGVFEKIRDSYFTFVAWALYPFEVAWRK